ncbi:uncharacterized protein TNCV_2742371 [Trichonephila clavipes]|nr:uncharacterized protein TNCV_2742371 [Trichonephila clavipes]
MSPSRKQKEWVAIWHIDLVTCLSSKAIRSIKGPWIHEVVSILVHVHQLDSIGNEARQTRQRVSSNQQSNAVVKLDEARCKALCRQGYTSGRSALKAHIYDAWLNGFHGDTCRWHSIKICRNLRKGCTSITLNDSRQSSLIPFFHDLFRPQQCRKFDVLPDPRYPRYTCEMAVREIPNFIPSSELLCPISHAPAITPRLNSLKSLQQMIIVAAVTYLTTVPDTCYLT